MSEELPDVLRDMVAMWSARHDGVPSEESGRSHSVRAADVRRALELRYGAERLREQLLAFLDDLCSTYGRQQSAGGTRNLVGDCALAMVTEEGGIDASDSADLIKRIVRGFPAPMWQFPVGTLIARYLGVTDLAELLSEGIRRPANQEDLENCLLGCWLYFGRARPDDDPRQGELLRQCLREVRELMRTGDPELRSLALNAERALERRVRG